MSTDLSALWNAIQRGDSRAIADEILSPKMSAATEPRPRVGIAQEGSSSPRADARTASVGALYPLTCAARYYDAANQILENEPPLFTHDNCNELGALIEAWIHRARNNWEPK